MPDLLLLIAATAVGLGGIRALSPDNEVYTWPYTPIPTPGRLNWVSVVASNWAFYLSPLLAAWSLGLLLVPLRRPWPRLRRLASQPGWSASCAALVGVMAGAVMAAVGVHGRYGIDTYFPLAGYPVGIAIGAVWTHLAASGRWRAEPSWFDRAGRILGVTWLAIVPLIWGRFLFTC